MLNSRLKLSLQWFLSFQLLAGGAMPLYAQPNPPPAPKQAAPPPPPSPELQELGSVAEQVADILSRAAYPNVDGEGGKPSPGELDALEKRLIQAGAGLRSLFQHRNFAVQIYNIQQDGETVGRTDEPKWVTQINFYFGLVEKYLLARYYATNDLSPESWGRFDFRLPADRFALLIFLATASEQLQEREEGGRGLERRQCTA